MIVPRTQHPDGEINFCIAITEMKNTTAIWSRSSPGKKTFTHGNKLW